MLPILALAIAVFFAVAKPKSPQRRVVAAAKSGDTGTMKSLAATFTPEGGRLAIESTAAAIEAAKPPSREALEGLAAALSMSGVASAAWAEAFVSEGRYDLGVALAEQSLSKR